MENSSEQAGRSQSTEPAYTINIFTNTQSVIKIIKEIDKTTTKY